MKKAATHPDNIPAASIQRSEKTVKVYLVHHVDALSKEQDPARHISALGKTQADRIGERLKVLGAAPARILHSDKQWTIDTAAHIASKLGATNRMVQTAYPINTDDPIAPFLADIAAAQAGNHDIMMCGHVDYLLRTASKLVCGDEKRKVVEFKPGNGTMACLESAGDQWFVTWMWRADHAPG
jgi:phosphohistidine phosphatase SixA